MNGGAFLRHWSDRSDPRRDPHAGLGEEMRNAAHKASMFASSKTIIPGTEGATDSFKSKLSFPIVNGGRASETAERAMQSVEETRAQVAKLIKKMRINRPCALPARRRPSPIPIRVIRPRRSPRRALILLPRHPHPLRPRRARVRHRPQEVEGPAHV